MSIPVKASEWPHGLRCMDCDRELVDGDLYAERLTGFSDDSPLCEIVCPECFGKGSA